MPQNDKALPSRLQEQKVEFVIIGGVCGVLHGAALVTLDLDICCRFSGEGFASAPWLTANKLPLELTDELCGSLKKMYLNTDTGVLDCLGEVAGVGDYEQVLQRTIPHSLSYGVFRILSRMRSSPRNPPSAVKKI